MNITKGQWKVIESENLQAKPCFDLVAEFANKFEYLGEIMKKDNARLIAAAPEMYDALVHIAEYWNRDANEMAMEDALWHIIETAESVLAKAKGESNEAL